MIRKLTESDVHGICKLLKEGVNGSDVAKQYGISKSYVSAIRCGRSQSHISKLYGLTVKEVHAEKLPAEKVHEICKMLIKKYKMQDIADAVGTTTNVVSNVRRGMSYQEISSKYVLTTRNYGTLTDDMVECICEMLQEGYSDRVIVDKLKKNGIKITAGQISGIRHKRMYKRVTSKYDLPLSSYYITDEQVKEICELLEKGYSNNSISKKVGVSHTTIDKVRKGKIRSEISSNYKIPSKSFGHLKENQVREICELLSQGKSVMEITELLDIKYNRVYHIYKRINYTNISKEYVF